MKQWLGALIACLALAGCHNSKSVTIHVLQTPEVLPTCPKQMSEQEAATLLGMILPVEVLTFNGFNDGGTVSGAIYDATGKYIGFRRSPWISDNSPIELYLTFCKGRGFDEVLRLNDQNQEIKVDLDDPRLKAFSVLSLGWVDRKFTKKEQDQIRKEQDMSEKGCWAGYVLWLFRPE